MPVARFPSISTEVTGESAWISTPRFLAASSNASISNRGSRVASCGSKAAARAVGPSDGSAFLASSSEIGSIARPSARYCATIRSRSDSEPGEVKISSVPMRANPIVFPDIFSTDATKSGYIRMLSFARGTSGSASKESGPGESIPAAAQEASSPGRWRSNTTTLSFSAESSHAIEAPITPPPMIATSAAFT